MRVLHVIARMNFGGTARYLVELNNGLTANGIENFIAAGHVEGKESIDPSAAGIRIIDVASLARSLNPLKDFNAALELRKIVAEIKPDIVHTHTFKAGLITRLQTGALKRVAKKDIKFIHTFHGHLFDDPEFSGPKAQIIAGIEKSLAKRTDVLVSVGLKVSTDLIARKIGTRQQFVNIPPGVRALPLADRRESRAKFGISADKAVIGWIARVTGVKNPMRAIEIARALPDTQFLLAGGGDLLDEIRAKAPENMKILGWSEPTELFAASDLILSTSENEGMPIALIEAQLAGLPVVATDAGSVAEVVLDGRTGFVTEKDSAALITACKSLIEQPELRAEMGQNARTHASKYFSIDGMVDSHLSMYNQMMK